MDVKIYCGEEIRITAVSEDGKTEKHLRVSWKSVMFEGVVLCDGLAPDEIQAIEDGRKIMAIKFCRTRTGFGLKEAKDLVDAYVAKNHCCSGFPNCAHFEQEVGVDLKLLSINDVGTLAMSWTYPGLLTEQQARKLMVRSRKSPDVFGFWSFMATPENTTWMSNRFNPV